MYITTINPSTTSTKPSLFSLLPFYTIPLNLISPLHTRRDQLALRLRIVVPAAGEGLAASLLGELLHAGLKLRAEVADQALDGPGEGFAEGWEKLVHTVSHKKDTGIKRIKAYRK